LDCIGGGAVVFHTDIVPDLMDEAEVLKARCPMIEADLSELGKVQNR